MGQTQFALQQTEGDSRRSVFQPDIFSYTVMERRKYDGNYKDIL